MRQTQDHESPHEPRHESGISHRQQTAFRVEQAALERNPDGASAGWSNPNNGTSGFTVPQSTYQVSNGQYCRDYQTTVVIDGRAETGRGTACRQADGSWRVVS